MAITVTPIPITSLSHSELTGVTDSQHHPPVTAHSELTGVSTSQHHAPVTSLAHSALTGVSTSQHHTLYTDAEAVTAVGPIILTESFVSSDQTITTAGALTLAHGLSSTPILVQCQLVCGTTEHGWSAGDVIRVVSDVGNNAKDQGVQIDTDGTNVVVRYAAEARVMPMANKTTGDVVVALNTSWTLRVSAWA